MNRIISVVVAVLFFAAPALAQKATVLGNAPIYLRADPPAGTTPLRTAAVGTILTVVREGDEWTQVEFQDPQHGLRTGWVRTILLKVERKDLQPLDLSIGKPAANPAPEQPPLSRPERTAQPPRKAEAPAAMPEQSPAMRARSAERGWLDVNLGMASAAQGTRETQATWLERGEIATFAATYKAPAGAGVDIGGGFMFTPVIGAGISVSGTAHMSPADLAISVPHPYYYNRYASDGAATEEDLTYTEGAVHIQAMLNVPTNNDRIRMRLFGGPSYFKLTGDAVTEVRWDQVTLFTANEVSITGYSAKEVTAEAWGFHAGADLSFFFSRVFGVGAVVRYSRGSVTVEDADVMADEPLELKVGGFQAAAGLRLRFGKK